jgi:hypothetical protein
MVPTTGQLEKSLIFMRGTHNWLIRSNAGKEGSNIEENYLYLR